MLTSSSKLKEPSASPPREGDLYKVIDVFGKSFEIYYGYYEDGDRYSKYPEPIEVFPDFIKNPVYTDDGYAFITAIQEPCHFFKKARDINDRCRDCVHYEVGEELIGLCKHRARRKFAEDR